MHSRGKVIGVPVSLCVSDERLSWTADILKLVGDPRKGDKTVFSSI